MVKRTCNVIAFIAVLAVLFGVMSTTPILAQDVFTGNPVAKIAKETSPAVVNIDVETMVTRSVMPFPDDPIFRERHY